MHIDVNTIKESFNLYDYSPHDGKQTLYVQQKAGRPITNWIDTILRDLEDTGMTWKE